MVNEQKLPFYLLEQAKEKILFGDYDMATAYYNRARDEGIDSRVVDLRFFTKNYLVYPLEYEGSIAYFSHILTLKNIAEENQEYLPEYKKALESLLDVKALFLRAVSLFYFSDIEVCSSDSVVVKEILELQKVIEEHKDAFVVKDVYSIKKHIPHADLEKFKRDLEEIEIFCLNLLITYTAEQHSVYTGKKYSAISIDYGYFIDTQISSRNTYYKYANLKPRLSVIGLGAYYQDYLNLYNEKSSRLRDFNSPTELKRHLTELVKHKSNLGNNLSDFRKYAERFEKQDSSRESYFGSLANISMKLNPLLKFNPFGKILDKRKICSFEIGNYFTRKKICGVCDMLSAGNGWSIDTVRALMIVGGCFVIGAFAYVGLAVAMKMDYYMGVKIEKH